MENDRLINKAGWLKYSLLCLLSCPLSVTAANEFKVDVYKRQIVTVQK